MKVRDPGSERETGDSRWAVREGRLERRGAHIQRRCGQQHVGGLQHVGSVQAVVVSHIRVVVVL